MKISVRPEYSVIFLCDRFELPDPPEITGLGVFYTPWCIATTTFPAPDGDTVLIIDDRYVERMEKKFAGRLFVPSKQILISDSSIKTIAIVDAVSDAPEITIEWNESPFPGIIRISQK